MSSLSVGGFNDLGVFLRPSSIPYQGRFVGDCGRKENSKIFENKFQSIDEVVIFIYEALFEWASIWAIYEDGKWNAIWSVEF